MEYHDVPPQQRPGNINAAPRFVEPKAHPVVDGYFRDKLRSTAEIAAKARQPQRNEEAYIKFRAKYDAAGIKRGVAQKFNEGYLEAVSDLMEDIEPSQQQGRIEGEITSLEMRRLQALWTAAARGDFTGVGAEISQDIADLNRTLSEYRQNPNAQADVQSYDTAVVEVAEWQASLQETPIDLVNTRLGRQINRTVVGLVQQRDSTHMATLNKQLKNLQRVQQTVNNLS